jgi:hypothetical protein
MCGFSIQQKSLTAQRAFAIIAAAYEAVKEAQNAML